MFGISRRLGQAAGRAADLPRIGHFLVVAGATGAGKSTFLEVLTSGKLQSEVKSLLPENVGSWILLSKRREEQTSAITEWTAGPRPPNVIVEYTLNNGKGQNPYATDDRLRLIKTADAVTIITLRASPERFASQLRHLMRPAWWQRWLKSRRTLNEQEKRGERWFELYARPGWLDDIYASWEVYLAQLVREGVPLREICLEPDPRLPVGRRVRWQVCPAQSSQRRS
jgi:hypothetical protein